jgi:hypothetical protein
MRFPVRLRRRPLAAQLVNRDGKPAETSSNSPRLSTLRSLAISFSTLLSRAREFAKRRQHLLCRQYEIRTHPRPPAAAYVGLRQGRRLSPWQNSIGEPTTTPVSSGMAYMPITPEAICVLSTRLRILPKAVSCDVDVSSARCCTKLPPTLRAIRKSAPTRFG